MKSILTARSTAAVVAALLILVVIWFSAHWASSTCRFSQRLSMGVSSAIHIRASLYRDGPDDTQEPTLELPTITGPDKTSTAFFQRLIDEGVLPVEPALFWCPGITMAEGPTLHPEANAWCINAGVTAGAPDTIPLLFTRNLHFTNVDGTVVAFLTDEEPFGRRGAIAADLRGFTFILRTSESLERLSEELEPSDIAHILRP